MKKSLSSKPSHYFKWMKIPKSLDMLILQFLHLEDHNITFAINKKFRESTTSLDTHFSKGYSLFFLMNEHSIKNFTSSFDINNTGLKRLEFILNSNSNKETESKRLKGFFLAGFTFSRVKFPSTDNFSNTIINLIIIGSRLFDKNFYSQAEDCFIATANLINSVPDNFDIKPLIETTPFSSDLAKFEFLNSMISKLNRHSHICSFLDLANSIFSPKQLKPLTEIALNKIQLTNDDNGDPNIIILFNSIMQFDIDKRHHYLLRLQGKINTDPNIRLFFELILQKINYSKQDISFQTFKHISHTLPKKLDSNNNSFSKELFEQILDKVPCFSSSTKYEEFVSTYNRILEIGLTKITNHCGFLDFFKSKILFSDAERFDTYINLVKTSLTSLKNYPGIDEFFHFLKDDSQYKNRFTKEIIDPLISLALSHMTSRCEVNKLVSFYCDNFKNPLDEKVFSTALNTISHTIDKEKVLEFFNNFVFMNNIEDNFNRLNNETLLELFHTHVSQTYNDYTKKLLDKDTLLELSGNPPNDNVTLYNMINYKELLQSYISHGSPYNKEVITSFFFILNKLYNHTFLKEPNEESQLIHEATEIFKTFATTFKDKIPQDQLGNYFMSIEEKLADCNDINELIHLYLTTFKDTLNKDHFNSFVNKLTTKKDYKFFHKTAFPDFIDKEFIIQNNIEAEMITLFRFSNNKVTIYHPDNLTNTYLT